MQTTVLKTFDNYFSANIMLARLQDVGINCFLKDEFITSKTQSILRDEFELAFNGQENV